MAKGDSEVEQIAAAIAAEGLGWTAAENELTALSPAERQGYLGLLVSPQELASFAAETAQVAAQETAAGVGAGLVGAPSAVDWRNNGGNFVTPIKNQGGCGSCVSFCSCSVIESAVRIKLGNPGFAIDLSEAFMQFCGGGSCNGWGLTSGLSFAQSTGVTDEACMPYQARNMDCGTSRCSDWQNRLTKINSFASHSTMAARKEAIARGPVLAGMEVWSDFFAYNGTAPYIKASTATRLSPPGYHCISVVGYDDAARCWIIKNSWGTTWGDNGFGRIGYGQIRPPHRLELDVLLGRRAGRPGHAEHEGHPGVRQPRRPERMGTPAGARMAPDPTGLRRRRHEHAGDAHRSGRQEPDRDGRGRWHGALPDLSVSTISTKPEATGGSTCGR